MFKLLFIKIILISSFSYAEMPAYSIGTPTKYPELVQSAIFESLKKPNPKFEASLDLPKVKLTSEFLAQLSFDKVTYKVKEKQNGLVRIDMNYSKAIENRYHGIAKNYYHIIGTRINKYIRSEECFFSKVLKDRQMEDFRTTLFDGMRGGIKEFWYLNYTSPNLVVRKNIDEALTSTGLYCNSNLKELSFFESFLDKIELLPKRRKVVLPKEYKQISLEYLLSKNYF